MSKNMAILFPGAEINVDVCRRYSTPKTLGILMRSRNVDEFPVKTAYVGKRLR